MPYSGVTAHTAMGCMGMLLCIDEPNRPLKRVGGWPILLGASHTCGVTAHTAMGCIGMLLCIDEPYRPLKREGGWSKQLGATHTVVDSPYSYGVYGHAFMY